MGTQIGKIREYTNVDESESKLLALCPLCKVKAVPRGISSSRPTTSGDKHCPNCGHVYRGSGNNGFSKHDGVGDTLDTPVIKINVTGAAGAVVITVDNETLQMSVEVLPAIATNKAITWSVVAGTGTASISADGLLTALTNGTVTAVATANDGSGTVGSSVITLSNQV